ncbi:hypothetical protein L9F63_000854, partial [Diploptera punctata]
ETAALHIMTVLFWNMFSEKYLILQLMAIYENCLGCQIYYRNIFSKIMKEILGAIGGMAVFVIVTFPG